MGWLLVLILVIVLLAALPRWPYSRGWGYVPSGTLTLIVVIVVLLVLLGYL